MDHVLFDLDDTLYDQAEPFALAYREVFEDRFALDPYALFPVSRTYSESVFDASEAGAMSMEDMYVYRIQRAIADFGYEADAASCLRMQYRYAELQESAITLTPTICELLEWCAGHAAPVIVSNGPHEHQMRKMEVLGLFRWVRRSDVFVSSAIGVAKPDPAHVFYACEALGCAPESCLFVGDSFGPDVVCAHRAKVPCIWFDRRGRPATDETVHPRWVVHTERELADLIMSGEPAAYVDGRA